MLDVNLSAAFACCRAAAPLLGIRGASVVNISSVHGTRARERLIAYVVSKGGIEMLTRTLAIEWAARGIRVNAVAPGYIETDLTAGLIEHERWRGSLLSRIPLGRFATTGDITPGGPVLGGCRGRVHHWNHPACGRWLDRSMIDSSLPPSVSELKERVRAFVHDVVIRARPPTRPPA